MRQTNTLSKVRMQVLRSVVSNCRYGRIKSTRAGFWYTLANSEIRLQSRRTINQLSRCQVHLWSRCWHWSVIWFITTCRTRIMSLIIVASFCRTWTNCLETMQLYVLCWTSAFYGEYGITHIPLIRNKLRIGFNENWRSEYQSAAGIQYRGFSLLDLLSRWVCFLSWF